MKNNKKIAFYLPHLDIQGTGVSNYDYAHFNQTILGNKSYMICDKDNKNSHPLAIEKFNITGSLCGSPDEKIFAFTSDIVEQ